MSKLLDTLRLPHDLRELHREQLEQICEELREELIDTVSTSGGHFASSLGATELTVALHHVFATPSDRLVWDVGHQGYVHKMLTGRREGLSRVRMKDGISGFLKREESEFDCFGAGHAGTSISAAVGMAVASKKQGIDREVVAIIGDGSMTCGMAFEAMNHAGSLGLDNLVVVLNDNEMSISPNVGAISWLFSKAVTSKASNAARTRFKNLYRKGYVPEIVYKFIDRAEEAAQGFFAGAAMLFEAFGFRYIGPIDGHNIRDLIPALEAARDQDVPVLVHIYTTKGKGFNAAEEDPLTWHGVTPFDKSKAVFAASAKKGPPLASYTNVFAKSLLELCQDDERLVAVTAAMPTGTGLDLIEREMPERFFDVGIAEQHAVTFAAGLACEGKVPVCAIYSTFLQRAYDQVLHDVCIQNLPVVFAMDRAGVVGNDGETHQGAFDISYLRCIPNITIMVPRNENFLRNMLYTATTLGTPVAIRYPRGGAEGVPMDPSPQQIKIGRGEVLRSGKDIAILGIGPVLHRALEVAERLYTERGLDVSVIDACFVKPLDRELIERCLREHRYVLTLEDHSVAGGFGSAVLELSRELGEGLSARIHAALGMQDFFTPHASQKEQYALHGYDEVALFRTLDDLATQLGISRAA